VEDLLEGAKAMRSRIEASSEVAENPAWLWGVLSHLHEKEGRNISVLMPYADGLEDFAEWFAQLWGESLGKGGLGTTPVRALGAIDQHSQVQLYAEGPDDKLYTLMAVREHPQDYAIPAPPGASLDALGYLEGHSFGEMLYAEAQATASALVHKGRPLFWLELPKLDAYRLGGLIFFFEYATALTGLLMGINPFDQLGVEQGKILTYSLMGRKGYEEHAQAVEQQRKIMQRLAIKA
jgi:glucose-6-phosphate isomerase